MKYHAPTLVFSVGLFAVLLLCLRYPLWPWALVSFFLGGAVRRNR